jgi:hypothetical protein
MKQVLVVVIAVAFISIVAVGSQAQVPNVQIYFGPNEAQLWDTQAECPGPLPPPVFEELYVVYQNFNAWISTAEFAVDFGPNFPLVYSNDLHPAGVWGKIWLGVSYDPNPPPAVSGITITDPIPGNGFKPFVVLRIRAIWGCEDCDLEGIPIQPITVVPHEGTGSIHAVEFQTFQIIPGIGMVAHVCPGLISTEEATWGQVKALYNN